MDTKIGAHITALRKAKGMTQEQLAAAVGVSAPAVSKWETDSSLPDISLLCPLARALEINVDTLLQFEEELPQEKVIECINGIVETARLKGLEAAEDQLQRLLNTYPSNSSLKYNASAVFDAFTLLFPAEAVSKSQKWEKQKKQLLEEVISSGNTQCRQGALISLAALALHADELEEAEKLLDELPDGCAEAAVFRSQIYMKKNEPDKALEVTQKCLYSLVRKLQMCLTAMMNGSIITEDEKTLEVCRVYTKLEEIFGVGGGVSEGFYTEAYRRMGRKEEALRSLMKMIDAFCGPALRPNPLLFSPAIEIRGEASSASAEMRQVLYNSIAGDEFFDEFRERQDFRETVEKLRN